MVRRSRWVLGFCAVLGGLSAPAAAAPSPDSRTTSRFYPIQVDWNWQFYSAPNTEKIQLKDLVEGTQKKLNKNPYQALLDDLDKRQFRPDDFELWYGLRSFVGLCHKVESSFKNTKSLGCGERLSSLIDLLQLGYKPFTMRAYIQGLSRYCYQLKSIQKQLNLQVKTDLNFIFYRWANRCQVGVKTLTMSTW